MRSMTILIALSASMLLGACAPGEENSTTRTDETTANLLTSATEASVLAPGRPVQSQDQEIDVALLGHDSGLSTAPVRVVEFSDYGCGYCRKFHQDTWPVLTADFEIGRAHV